MFFYLVKNKPISKSFVQILQFISLDSSFQMSLYMPHPESKQCSLNFDKKTKRVNDDKSEAKSCSVWPDFAKIRNLNKKFKTFLAISWVTI